MTNIKPGQMWEIGVTEHPAPKEWRKVEVINVVGNQVKLRYRDGRAYRGSDDVFTATTQEMEDALKYRLVEDV
jgi:hypothetical protein